MALMALPLAQCSCYFIVITAGCVRPSERDFVNPRWLKASCFRSYVGGDERYLRAGKHSSGSVTEWYTTATLGRLTRLTLLALIWTWITSPSPRILRNEDGWCGAANHGRIPTVKIHRGASATCRRLRGPYVCCHRATRVVTSHPVNVRKFCFVCKLHIYTNDCTFIFYVIKS